MQIRARITSLVCFAGLLPALLTGCSGGAGKLPPAFEVVDPASVQDTTPRHYYVDGSLRMNPCPAYVPATRQCGGGRDLAFNNLADANGMARAGDVIELREDRYNQPIRPQASGTSNAPLTYRAFPGEAPVIVVAEEPALQLRQVQHVVIRGIHFDNSLGWGRLEEAHHNHIVGNTFTEALARGTTGGLKLVRSHYNRIENNRFHRGNDAIVIQDSGHNLVTDNHLEFARHTLISIRCGNYNVVRRNYLHNARQKAAEIYDCEGISDAPVKYDVTKRNLWEFNHFAHVTGSSEPDNFNGIQYSAQAGIVRHNWFIDNRGGALQLAIYAEEALYVYGNRIYGNRFLHNRCGALSAGNLTPLRAGDNRVQGNIFAGNLNCLGTADRVARHPVYSLVGNLETGQDQAALPEIWPAMTTAAGSGASMVLDDVLPFYDGYNISGETGDQIELRSSRQRARITGIDYTTKSLRLDRAVQWTAGEGVRVIIPDVPRPERHPGFPPQ